MSSWMKLESTRRQVAIAGSVRDALTGQAIHRCVVKIERAPEVFTRWLAMQAMQHRDQWQTVPDHPEQQSISLNPSFALLRESGKANNLSFVTYTAADGYFYWIDLPDGSYTLSASWPGTGTRYGIAQVENLQVRRDSSGTIQRATAEIELPPTAIQGTVTEQVMNSQTKSKSEPTARSTPIVLAKVQVEGSSAIALSDREGNYCLTGLEVWKQSSAQAPRPVVSVSAQGYQSLSQGVWLSQGQVKTLNFQLVRKSLSG